MSLCGHATSNASLAMGKDLLDIHLDFLRSLL